jgi:hypothetical protein
MYVCLNCFTSTVHGISVVSYYIMSPQPAEANKKTLGLFQNEGVKLVAALGKSQ